MQAYCIHTVVTQSGTMTLKNVPFRPGEDVEVIIVRRVPQTSSARNDAPLRGMVRAYHDPTAPVKEENYDNITGQRLSDAFAEPCA